MGYLHPGRCSWCWASDHKKKSCLARRAFKAKKKALAAAAAPMQTLTPTPPTHKTPRVSQLMAETATIRTAVEKLHAMFEQGVSREEIVQKTGYAPTTVRDIHNAWKRARGIKEVTRPQHWAPAIKKLEPHRDVLGTIPDRHAAARFGVCRETVRDARRLWGIPVFKAATKKETQPTPTPPPPPPPPPPRNVSWAPGKARQRLDAVKHLFGKKTDAEIAQMAGVNLSSVMRYRKANNVPPLHTRVSHADKPTHAEIYELFERLSLPEIAERTGYALSTLENLYYARKRARWLFELAPRADQHPLNLHRNEVGKSSDSDVAQKFGVSRETVREFRSYFGIPPFVPQ